MANKIEAAGVYPVVDRLLQQTGVKVGGTQVLAEVEQGVELVAGAFSYERRCITVPGRPLLTGEFTTQPAVALREIEGARVRPLPYAEDVANLPFHLASRVLGVLEALR